MATIVEQWTGPALQLHGGPRDGEALPNGCYRMGQLYDASREGHYRIETRNGTYGGYWVQNPSDA